MVFIKIKTSVCKLLSSRNTNSDLDVARTFQIENKYINELEELSKDRSEKPRISPEIYVTALQLIVLFEQYDSNDAHDGPKPSVLIFLPGNNEIRRMYHFLDEWCSLYAYRVLYLLFNFNRLTTKSYTHSPQNLAEII